MRGFAATVSYSPPALSLLSVGWLTGWLTGWLADWLTG